MKGLCILPLLADNEGMEATRSNVLVRIIHRDLHVDPFSYLAKQRQE